MMRVTRTGPWTTSLSSLSGCRLSHFLFGVIPIANSTEQESGVPKFNFSIPHPLSSEDARAKLDRFIEGLEAKFADSAKDIERSWEGDSLVYSFKTYGITIAGRMTVEEGSVAVEGDLPITAMMFKGKIESEIKKNLERLLK